MRRSGNIPDVVLLPIHHVLPSGNERATIGRKEA